MNKADTTHLIQKQKAFFATGKTHSLAFRMHALAMLKRAIEIHEKRNPRCIGSRPGQKSL